jgi:putative sterol carrier protein
MASVGQSLAEMVGRFRTEAAHGVQAVFELDLSGDGGGKWHIKVSDGKCELASGPAQDPTVSIAMSVEDWGKLIARTLDAEQAFYDGRVRVTGDLYLATQLGAMFGF